MTRLTRSLTSGPAAVLGGWPGEDHDVAPVHTVQVVAQLVDEDAVADLERGLHGAGRDEEGLHDEGAQQDRDQHGDDHHDDALADPAAGGRACRRLLGRTVGCRSAAPRSTARRGLVDGERRVVRFGRHRRQARRRGAAVGVRPAVGHD